MGLPLVWIKNSYVVLQSELRLPSYSLRSASISFDATTIRSLLSFDLDMNISPVSKSMWERLMFRTSVGLSPQVYSRRRSTPAVSAKKGSLGFFKRSAAEKNAASSPSVSRLGWKERTSLQKLSASTYASPPRYFAKLRIAACLLLIAFPPDLISDLSHPCTNWRVKSTHSGRKYGSIRRTAADSDDGSMKTPGIPGKRHTHAVYL